MSATTNAQPNAFNVTGLTLIRSSCFAVVATDATIKSFESSAVARFPLSLSHREGKGDEVVRKSALINCEVWSNSADSKRLARSSLALLKKGQLVIVSGYISSACRFRNAVEKEPRELYRPSGHPTEPYHILCGAKRQADDVCTSVGTPNGTMTAKTTTMAETAIEPVHETEVVPF